jgi:hypothetical protein
VFGCPLNAKDCFTQKTDVTIQKQKGAANDNQP